MPHNLLCPRCGHELPSDLFARQAKANCPACGSELDAARMVGATRPPRPAPAAPPAEAAVEDDESVQIQRRTEESEMDMTPMVDIVFQLLIFFMVTASFALQRSIEIPKPEENRPSTNAASTPKDIESDPDFVVVRVDSLGTFHVLAVDWDQEEDAPSQQELIIKLKRARLPDSQGRIPFKMLVKAHGDSTHGRVVLALDAGPIVGLREVQLQTTEEDE